MVIIELIKTSVEKGNKTSSFKLITRLELISVKKGLEKLKTVFEYKNYFEYAIINEINKSLNALEAKRHESIYLSREAQEKIINLISDLSKFTVTIKSVQDLFYDQQRLISQDMMNSSKIKSGKLSKASYFKTNKENEESFDKKCNQLLIDLVEINRDIDEMVAILIK